MDIKQYESTSGKLGGFSLSKVLNKKVIDVNGYVSMEFGEPVFKMSSVLLENGEELWCEGEHDMPYVTSGSAEIDDELLQSIHDAENHQEDEDE